MKKIFSMVAAVAITITTHSYGMQADKNHYIIYNNTPDATIIAEGASIDPNSRVFQHRCAASSHFEILMPQQMRVSFSVPGHHSVSLAKLVDQNQPNKLMYRLATLNLLTAQAAERIITPPADAQAPQVPGGQE